MNIFSNVGRHVLHPFVLQREDASSLVLTRKDIRIATIVISSLSVYVVSIYLKLNRKKVFRAIVLTGIFTFYTVTALAKRRLLKELEDNLQDNSSLKADGIKEIIIKQNNFKNKLDFSSLPEDIKKYILSFLSLRNDLNEAALICKQINRLIPSVRGDRFVLDNTSLDKLISYYFMINNLKLVEDLLLCNFSKEYQFKSELKRLKETDGRTEEKIKIYQILGDYFYTIYCEDYKSMSLLDKLKRINVNIDLLKEEKIKIYQLLRKHLSKISELDFSHYMIGDTIEENEEIIEESLKLTRKICSRINKIIISSPNDKILILINKGTLKSLQLLNANKITNLNYLATFKNLNSLEISNTSNFKDISFLAQLVNLTSLSLGNLQVDDDLSPLANLVNLTWLCFEYSQFNGNFPSLTNVINLTELSFLRCELNGNFSPLAKIVNLTKLSFRSSEVRTLLPLKKLTKLNMLSLHRWCKKFKWESLNEAVSIKKIVFEGGYYLRDVSSIGKLTELTYLELYDYDYEIDLNSFLPLVKLTELKLHRIYKLKDLSPLSHLKQLKVLHLSHCSNVEDVSMIPKHVILSMSDMTGLKPKKNEETEESDSRIIIES